MLTLLLDTVNFRSILWIMGTQLQFASASAQLAILRLIESPLRSIMGNNALMDSQ